MKVMFLHLSVSHSVYRWALPQCMLGCTPPHPPGPETGTPPDQRQTPSRTRGRNPPPPEQCMLGDMGASATRTLTCLPHVF